MNKEVLKYLADHEQAALKEFLTKLREQHGSEVVLVSLFGSKVRGDFDEESDIDVLLVVEDRTSRLWEDIVEIEAEAVLLILTHLETGKWQWIGSEVLDLEIEQTPDPQRRHRVKLLTAHVHHYVLVKQAEVERAQQLEALGFHPFDALHLACAESGDADVFLTTDDKLLRRATRLFGQLHVQVENPLTWLKEVIEQ